MKFAIAVSIALLMGSTALEAQSFGTAQMEGMQPSRAQNSPPAGIAVLQLPSLTIGCPVSLRAQHLADGSVVRTKSAHPAGTGQWLHITLTNPRQIREATVTVHGFSDKARITRTLSSGQNASDSAWTTTLSFPVAQANTAAADVRVPGMTTVETIELKTVTYADGSVWKFSAGSSCRVAPDPLMLVAGQK